jgi:NTP pyrophosphatase (non-canonical NTP hydrolase)
VEFDEYQRRAAITDQRRGDDPSDVMVHLLGLAGEAGSVAAEYKKYLRDGTAHAWWKMRMREELGDVLWYLASICNHLDLSLNEIAAANLEKAKDRWEPGDTAALDAKWPAE